MASACMCPASNETAKEIYDRVDGIYYVAIVGINRVSTKNISKSSYELVLDLEIIDSIKGTNSGIINAKARGRIPFVGSKGGHIKATGSCDMHLSFGQSYILAIKNNEEVKISRCNPQILDFKWSELKNIHTNFQKNQ